MGVGLYRRTIEHLLCPICLRKLEFSLQFSHVERYETLLKFYKKVQLENAVQWVEKRLQLMKAFDKTKSTKKRKLEQFTQWMKQINLDTSSTSYFLIN